MKKQKLYCYVDETGQDTEGDFFLVAVVIFDADRKDELYRWLLEIEKSTEKREQKWTRASWEERRDYISSILNNSAFAGIFYFSSYRDTVAYDDLMILSIAKAMNAHVASSEYIAIILIDGLPWTQKLKFSRILRKFRVKFRKIHGANDKYDPFVRLADALAGFVRDARAGDLELQKLYERALRKGIIHEI